MPLLRRGASSSLPQTPRTYPSSKRSTGACRYHEGRRGRRHDRRWRRHRTRARPDHRVHRRSSAPLACTRGRRRPDRSRPPARRRRPRMGRPCRAAPRDSRATAFRSARSASRSRPSSPCRSTSAGVSTCTPRSRSTCRGSRCSRASRRSRCITCSRTPPGLIEGAEASLDPRHEVWLLRGQRLHVRARRALRLLQRRLQAGRSGARGPDGRSLPSSCSPTGVLSATRHGRQRPGDHAGDARDDGEAASAALRRPAAARRAAAGREPLVRDGAAPTAASCRRRPTCAPTRGCCSARGEAPGGRLLARGELRPAHRPARRGLRRGGHAWYGYGLETWDVDGRILIGHSGGMVGFTSYLLTDPDAGSGRDRPDERHREPAGAGTLCPRGGGRAAGAGQSLPEPPPPSDPALLGGRRR